MTANKWPKISAYLAKAAAAIAHPSPQGWFGSGSHHQKRKKKIFKKHKKDDDNVKKRQEPCSYKTHLSFFLNI